MLPPSAGASVGALGAGSFSAAGASRSGFEAAGAGAAFAACSSFSNRRVRSVGTAAVSSLLQRRMSVISSSTFLLLLRERASKHCWNADRISKIRERLMALASSMNFSISSGRQTTKFFGSVTDLQSMTLRKWPISSLTSRSMPLALS